MRITSLAASLQYGASATRAAQCDQQQVARPTEQPPRADLDVEPIKPAGCAFKLAAIHQVQIVLRREEREAERSWAEREHKAGDWWWREPKHPVIEPLYALMRRLDGRFF